MFAYDGGGREGRGGKAGRKGGSEEKRDEGRDRGMKDVQGSKY